MCQPQETMDLPYTRPHYTRAGWQLETGGCRRQLRKLGFNSHGGKQCFRQCSFLFIYYILFFTECLLYKTDWYGNVNVNERKMDRKALYYGKLWLINSWISYKVILVETIPIFLFGHRKGHSPFLTPIGYVYSFVKLPSQAKPGIWLYFHVVKRRRTTRTIMTPTQILPGGVVLGLWNFACGPQLPNE